MTSRSVKYHFRSSITFGQVLLSFAYWRRILRRLNWWPACFRIPTIRVFNLPHHLSFFLNLFEFLVYIYDTCTLLCASSRFKSVVYFFRQQFNQLCSIVRQRQYEVHSCLSLR